MSAALTAPSRQPSTRRLARHEVREAVEKQILDGKIKPGAKLVQLQLSKTFGVSLGVVREALLDLQKSGLVESVDNHGMFVRRMDARAVRECYLVREAFEGLAAREACGRITPMQADELRCVAREIFELAKAGRERAKAELDRALHLRIAELSGVKMLVDLARQHRVLGKVITAKADPQHTLRTHLNLIDALMSGDPDHAEAVARQNIRAGLREVEGLLARGGDSPRWMA